MMRFHIRLGLALAVILGSALRADARPQKVDYHSSVCQKISGAIAYDPLGITAVGTTKVVCPLDNITLPGDTTANSLISFKVRYQNSITKCELRSQGTMFVSIPAITNPSPAVAASGSAIVPLPTMADSDPASLHLWCDIPNTGVLGTIQVTTAPSP